MHKHVSHLCGCLCPSITERHPDCNTPCTCPIVSVLEDGTARRRYYCGCYDEWRTNPPCIIGEPPTYSFRGFIICAAHQELRAESLRVVQEALGIEG